MGTLDAELHALMEGDTTLIRDYLLTSHRQRLEREASDNRIPYPEHPYADGFMRLRKAMLPAMKQRIIRAWHFTRMTDDEIGGSAVRWAASRRSPA